MGWYKQHSSFSENPFNKPTVDRCINCGQTKEVKTTITMEFGEDIGNLVGKRATKKHKNLGVGFGRQS